MTIRSFEFYQDIPKGDSMKDPAIFQQEIEIIFDYTSKKNGNYQLVNVCPCCHSNNISLFFKKWGIPYLRCNNCNTIYSPVTKEDVAEYTSLQSLNLFRRSISYQNDMVKRRQVQWIEYNDWVYLRAFKYLGKKTGYRILDVGNRYEGLSRIIKNSDYCSTYENVDSVLSKKTINEVLGEFDIIILNDVICQSNEPQKDISKYLRHSSPNGLIIMNIRGGSGFDILTTKENAPIFPYEHVLLPTEKGLDVVFNELGMEIIEFSTPGVMDFRYVLDHKESISDDNFFIKQLVEISNPGIHADFQYFLQKSGMSSFIRLIARKCNVE